MTKTQHGSWAANPTRFIIRTTVSSRGSASRRPIRLRAVDIRRPHVTISHDAAVVLLKNGVVVLTPVLGRIPMREHPFYEDLFDVRIPGPPAAAATRGAAVASSP